MRHPAGHDSLMLSYTEESPEGSTEVGMYMSDAVFFNIKGRSIRDLIIQGNYFSNLGVLDLHLNDNPTSNVNILNSSFKVNSAQIIDNNISGNYFMGGGVQAIEGMNLFCVEGLGNTYSAEAQHAPNECP